MPLCMDASGEATPSELGIQAAWIENAVGIECLFQTAVQARERFRKWMEHILSGFSAAKEGGVTARVLGLPADIGRVRARSQPALGPAPVQQPRAW